MFIIKSSAGSRRGIYLVSAAAILWGTIGIAAQLIYRQSDLTPVVVGFYRLALGFPAVALLCWRVVGRGVFQITRSTGLRMLAIGVMVALFQVSYFTSIEYVGVAIATLITLCMAPVLVALASVLFLKEALTRTTLTALLCALSGTILLVGAPRAAVELDRLFIGALYAVVSAAGYALMTLIGKGLAGKCHPLHSTAVAFGVGALCLLPLVVAAGGHSWHLSINIWSLLVYLGLVPTAVGYTLFFIGVRDIRASISSILTMIEPLTATLLAWWLFGEQLGPVALLGAGLLFVAIGVLYCGERTPRIVSCEGGEGGHPSESLH